MKSEPEATAAPELCPDRSDTCKTSPEDGRSPVDTYVPQPLALGALHPAAARRGLGRLQVRPELGLRQGHQRRRRDGQVVVLVRLRLRLVLRGRLQRGLERGLLLGLRLRLVRRGQRGVQGPLPCQRRQR